MESMKKSKEREALAMRDALAAQVDELRRSTAPDPSAQDQPLFRFRVTALLDSGATLDCGVYLACSVPQLIKQARRSLSPHMLSQVVNWRLDEAKDENPADSDELD
jgi:hypothetical protein